MINEMSDRNELQITNELPDDNGPQKITKVSFGKAALIGFFTLLIYFFFAFSKKDLGAYGGLFILSLSPLAFCLGVGWTYLVVNLEKRGYLAPYFLFRFLLPFLFFCILAWSMAGKEYINEFQGYTFGRYMELVKDFSLDIFLPIGITALMVALMLSPTKSK